VKDALQNFHWEGNVRQLFNVLRYGFGYCTSDTISLDDLPSDFTREIFTGGSVQDNKDENSKSKTSDQPLHQTLPGMRGENLWEELNPTKRNTITKDATDIEIIKKALLKGHGSPSRAARLLKEAGFKKNISSGAIRNMLGDSNSEKAVVKELRSWYISNFNTPLVLRIKQK
jgi:DNA-binding NtrC family response regulator